MSRHILVLGGTSASGVDFCLAALRDGHTLTLFVRNANRIPAEIASHVNKVVGQLNDATAVERAISCGAKTCVSFIGPVAQELKKGHKPVTDGYALILPLLRKHNYTRLLSISTASYRAPQDGFSLLTSILVYLVYLFGNAAYQEINGFTPLIASISTEELEWTVARVPVLRKGEAKEVKAGFVGQGVSIMLERKGLAEWMLKELEERKWVGKCPVLGNA
ncbi:hypothetical protein EJ04DRAFT_566594 [Polyplosphaeria fusca]|uniref:NAD(P)-binding domain-containing protein n=1 Tax=Polyplosphaeria fusca TaxID=682080 RepID=A0A9P4QV88_9PLEO|nr:hypothetical protein EJ04DRAFT_566594 [Polyplosphaeria fusca]